MLNFGSIFLIILSTEGMVVDVKHLGLNQQGWQVAETSHFIIFHNQPKEFIEQVAFIAENTRFKMSRKWFGNSGETWTPKCILTLYNTSEDYARITGAHSSSLGHTNIIIDQSSRRVIGRYIDLHCDIFNMLEKVLPHETTHILLAGQFGKNQAPPWVDEGIAILSGPKKNVDMHLHHLVNVMPAGDMFGLKEFMEMKNHPPASRSKSFCAQAVGLINLLVKERGPIVFTNFIREGLVRGYDASLRSHYDCDFTSLEKRWQQFLSDEVKIEH